ncbi:sugar ABC transporter ATP-binding protein [Hamadaea sp. NPDC051192]|uniref:sugar ABC transporter ATP-binding protein n=1 Tax=Hamadaea sp. NPDC051192 TaxID=3154940 RepID=UPI003445CDE8
MISPETTPVRDETPAPAPPRLSLDHMSITFGRTRVLHDVAFDVAPGEIHALIGQNGSGKSTVAKILTGLYAPDTGTQITVDGRPMTLPVRPQECRARGVAVVHQSLGLVGDATVLENIRVGRVRGSRWLRRIDWAHERAAAEAVFERLGRRIALDSPVSALREDERATVAIARALQDFQPGSGLIIFDESTRALGRQALEQFFLMLDGIVATGTAALLITHRLEEVIEAADRVTVLRDGRTVVAGRQVEGLDKAGLAALMLGRTADDLAERRPSAPALSGEPVRVKSLGGLRVKDLSLDVRPGEVVGLTGLGGSGYDDVLYLLGGITRADRGTVTLPQGDVDVPALTPAKAISAGLALVPEGRETAGLAAGMSLAENLALPQTCTRPGIRPLNAASELALANRWIEQLDIRPPRPHAEIRTFSGGNQQKVLLAKWLATGPSLLLLHEPTQAVDVGARHTIVEAIRSAAASEGRAVLVASSDENELALLCDRLLIFRDGAVCDELAGDLTPDLIVKTIYAKSAQVRLRSRMPTES